MISKFQIKNRFTGAVLFECQLTAEMETARDAVKLGFAVKIAVKARENLARAYLAGADLARANLAGANLAGAYLADTYLARANLALANLAGANLAGADLAGTENVPENTAADFVSAPDRATREAERAARFRERFPEVPVIKNLDAKILAKLSVEGCELDMQIWHRCETTHCRAGWAITLAGEAGKRLEKLYGPEDAGRRIYIASTGYVPNFYATDDAALADIKARAEAQS